MSTSLSGTRIGRFRVDRLLGKGGMGAVYAAFDEKLERDVALKVLLEDGESPAQRKRLLREARIAAKLQHPNIATVYEVEERDEQLIIVMELLEGKSLRRALLERKLGIEEAIAIARDMARGVARAHTAGVVHRDIKPENVFLTSLGGDAQLAKLLDFGLARQRVPAPTGAAAPHEEHTSTNTTSRGEMWGTPGYVSPEQALGQKDIDARTDIFSLGVVLYEMLANIRPFRGETAVATMIATTRNEPRPLRAIVSDLPPDLDEIVKRCLRKKKEERFADGAELAAALEAFARGGSAHSVRLPSIGSSPSLPLLARPSSPSYSGEEAPTTGSAALSLTTRDETVLPPQEHRHDRAKLFVALTIAAAVLLLSGVLLIAVSLTAARKPVVAAASASASALEPEPTLQPVAAEPAASPETPEPEPPAEAAVAPAPRPVAVRPAPAPRPVPPPAGSGKKAKPADCAKSPFTVDSKGVRIPKVYCF